MAQLFLYFTVLLQHNSKRNSGLTSNELSIMAKLTNEQIEQKKQLLAEKVGQMKAIYDELVAAGAIELSDNNLDQASGGFHVLHPPYEADPIIL